LTAFLEALLAVGVVKAALGAAFDAALGLALLCGFLGVALAFFAGLSSSPVSSTLGWAGCSAFVFLLSYFSVLCWPASQVEIWAFSSHMGVKVPIRTSLVNEAFTASQGTSGRNISSQFS
jgi:hypothetical protein